MSAAYRSVAEAMGAGFLDAGMVITSDGFDRLHLTAAAQRRLGEAVVQTARRLFANRFD